MHKRLNSFLSVNKVIIEQQYGFQKGKSTEHAILNLHSLIVNSLENKKTSCAIFLDLAKAFDTVNHEILLLKMYHYGVRGTAHKWFQSYFSNRKQCVDVKGNLSEFDSIEHGVAQGSILGPLLFLIYINDIINSSSYVRFLLFADDTSIFCSDKDPKQLKKIVNQELSNISNWLKANKLSLNENQSSSIQGIKQRKMIISK